MLLWKHACKDMALREKFESSLIALKEYFDPSRQSESASNPGQLVLFAEHAVKVDN